MNNALPIPELEADSETFWRSCRVGKLMIDRCQSCGWFVHPPVPVCAKCRGVDVKPEQVSGRGVLVSFTSTIKPGCRGWKSPSCSA